MEYHIYWNLSIYKIVKQIKSIKRSQFLIIVFLNFIWYFLTQEQM